MTPTNAGQKICPLCKQGNSKFIGFRQNGPQGLFPVRGYSDAYKVFMCNTCDLVYGDQKPTKDKMAFETDDSLLDLIELNAESIKE